MEGDGIYVYMWYRCVCLGLPRLVIEFLLVHVHMLLCLCVNSVIACICIYFCVCVST